MRFGFDGRCGPQKPGGRRIEAEGRGGPRRRVGVMYRGADTELRQRSAPVAAALNISNRHSVGIRQTQRGKYQIRLETCAVQADSCMLAVGERNHANFGTRHYFRLQLQSKAANHAEKRRPQSQRSETDRARGRQNRTSTD
jgi:hypothetical protein